MPDARKLPLGPCLEPEVLAAYVEGSLRSDERAAAEAHLAACGDCYTLLTEVMRTIDDMDGRESRMVLRPTFGRRRVWSVAAGVLAAAAALVLVVRVHPEWWQRIVGDGNSDARLEELIAAAGTDRTIEARLTGGFAYGPPQSPTRAGGGSANLSLAAAVGELQRSAEADPSPDNLHAFGVGQILLGRYDDAVKTLEQALAGQPATARFLSDVSAAYLARSVQRADPDDMRRALAAADRALRADRTLSEALFNRALALERLGMRDQAIQAWRAVIAEDDSAWREEAERHLRLLTAATRATPGQSVAASLE